MDARQSSAAKIWRGAAAGALGGIVASSAMVLFNHLLGATGFGRQDLGDRHQHRRVDAKPNDTDGTIPDEPASRKAASLIAETVTGRPLDEAGKRIGGPLVHHAFGAFAGALYGAAAETVPQLAAGGGMPYGAAVWLAGPETGVPLAGLSRHPTSYPPARHAASFATHLVFGATLEAVRRVITRR
jgi:putative membrane protein